MIKDNQIQEACKEVDTLLLTESNKTLIKETTDALIQLNKDKIALGKFVTDLSFEAIQVRKQHKATLKKYKITFVVLVGLILLLLVL